MTWTWHNPERDPTPEKLAAWADGELSPAEAARIEAWLAEHPEAVDDAEAPRRLVGLFRDHAACEPSPDAWQATLAGIHAGLSVPPVANAPGSPARGPRWRVRLVVGLTAAAALLGGVLVASRWVVRTPTVGPPPVAERRFNWPPGDDNDEPFAVVNAGAINVLSMHPDDADFLVLGQPLLGTVEFVNSEEIEVVKVMPDAEEGNMPLLHKGPMMPMIVLARVEDE
jgi:hypothetical protein